MKHSVSTQIITKFLTPLPSNKKFGVEKCLQNESQRGRRPTITAEALEPPAGRCVTWSPACQGHQRLTYFGIRVLDSSGARPVLSGLFQSLILVAKTSNQQLVNLIALRSRVALYQSRQYIIGWDKVQITKTSSTETVNSLCPHLAATLFSHTYENELRNRPRAWFSRRWRQRGLAGWQLSMPTVTRTAAIILKLT